ncbi:MAG: Eco57I restriction-modification methylase domain-containing protein [Bacteroidetes bacterium]|nr:Eco57I restriction-modification methylase domain-containing protein [Bacteroidota bacterium]
MKNYDLIGPLENELPSQYADRLGQHYALIAGQEHKKKNGQFFTPLEISRLMASYSDHSAENIRILDPGCGTAVLGCSLVEHIIHNNRNTKKIYLVVYEIDENLIPFLKLSLDFLKQWCLKQQLDLDYSLICDDFILDNADCLIENNDLFSKISITFDIIISNPPYFKLSIDDKRVIAAKVVVNGHPNIYAIFMAISAKLLKKNGELIFITPRSFASGGYFKVFRQYFFKLIQIEKVHLFNSRKETFNRDKVLQETLIIKGSRKEVIDILFSVPISSSQGLKDIDSPQIVYLPHNELIDLTSEEKILYTPVSDVEKRILGQFKNWNGNLNKYNIQISTGPVVSFRAWDFIQENSENGHVHPAPLFWLHNVLQMRMDWPLIKEGKGQYIKILPASRSLLCPNKNYVLLRRFSSKDDKSRLIAAPYLCSYIEADFIGIENKLNYIYRPKGHLDRNEVIGLCALLNSPVFDTFFRIFNGNVNVSATELRDMPLPPLETIKEIGNSIILSNDFSVENTNRLVSEHFEQSMITYG